MIVHPSEIAVDALDFASCKLQSKNCVGNCPLPHLQQVCSKNLSGGCSAEKCELEQLRRQRSPCCGRQFGFRWGGPTALFERPPAPAVLGKPISHRQGHRIGPRRHRFTDLPIDYIGLAYLLGVEFRRIRSLPTLTHGSATRGSHSV
jgi:hypothetical protein